MLDLSSKRSRWPAVAGLLLLALGLSAPAPAQNRTDDDPGGQIVQRASEHLREQRYRKAVETCAEMQDLATPAAELCLLILSISHNHLEHWDDAITASRRLIEISRDPRGVAMGHRELGTALARGAKEGGRWPDSAGWTSRPKPERFAFMRRLEEAEASIRHFLDVVGDDTGMVQLALVDVLSAKMVYGRFEHGAEMKELAGVYLSAQPDGPEAEWAREVTCFDRTGAVDPALRPPPPPPYSSETVRPKKIFDPQPSFSKALRRAAVHGVVNLRGVITETGELQGLEVLKGLPFCGTEDSIEALSKWRFEPATLDGEPVSVPYNVTVNVRW